MVELAPRASLWESGRSSSHNDADVRGDPRLGLLGQLKGTWTNDGIFGRRMWNLIALPFGPASSFPFQYRLLMNQGNERLRVSVGDLAAQNRGLDQRDQHVAALFYLQEINQINAADAAASDTSGGVTSPATPDVNDTPKGDRLTPMPGVIDPSQVGIHKESGIFFTLSGLAGPCDDLDAPGPRIGRLATIPHGDTVLAMGFDGPQFITPGPPNFDDPQLIAAFDALPEGLDDRDLSNPYLAPYKFFADNPFKGVETRPGFPGFSSVAPLGLLKGSIERAFAGSQTTILETTTIHVDSDISGNVSNIPFVNCEAQASKVTAVFWIQRLEVDGATRFALQYAQRVLLDFGQRFDGQPGRMRWPHITINTLIRSLDEDA